MLHDESLINTLLLLSGQREQLQISNPGFQSPFLVQGHTRSERKKQDARLVTSQDKNPSGIGNSLLV